MISRVRLLPSRQYGSRTVVTMVREQTMVHTNGAMVAVTPLGLLIREEGQWSAVVLEGDSIAELDRMLSPSESPA